MIFNIIKFFIEDTLRIKNVERKYILYDCEKTEIENIRPYSSMGRLTWLHLRPHLRHSFSDG